MESRVRPFQKPDEDAVVELSLRAWEPVFSSFREVLGDVLYERYYPDWRAQQAEAIREALDDNDSWVTFDGGTITGFVNLTFDAEGQIGEIYMIAVDPAHQRSGLATVLTEYAIAEMRRRGMTLATVSTGGDPGHAPARRAYEKAGFTPFPQVLYSKVIEPDDQDEN